LHSEGSLHREEEEDDDLFVSQAQEDTTTTTATGTVVSLWRYPVKSMLGEELNSSYVTERGLVGDRAYALIDQETGKVASAKNPRKWGKLFDFRAAFIEDTPPQVVENILPPVRITFPDGTHIFSSDQDYIDHSLSSVLGREVRLMRATNLEKPSYEEYWPDIEGLAQREKVTDEAMPPQTFFDMSSLLLQSIVCENSILKGALRFDGLGQI
jgi:hypothetical protein